MLYKRSTLDGQYWALTDGRKVWTRSPSHTPGDGGAYHDPEVAKRSVDFYIDVIAPHHRAEEIPPKEPLIGASIRTIIETAGEA